MASLVKEDSLTQTWLSDEDHIYFTLDNSLETVTFSPDLDGNEQITEVPVVVLIEAARTIAEEMEV